MSDQNTEHNLEHNTLDHEDPLAGPTWIIGLLGSVLLVVVVFGLMALIVDVNEIEFETKETSIEYPIAQVEAGQLARLSGEPHWRVEKYEDPKTGGAIPVSRQLIIPIDMAMQKIINEAR